MLPQTLSNCNVNFCHVTKNVTHSCILVGYSTWLLALGTNIVLWVKISSLLLHMHTQNLVHITYGYELTISTFSQEEADSGLLGQGRTAHFLALYTISYFIVSSITFAPKMNERSQMWTKLNDPQGEKKMF